MFKRRANRVASKQSVSKMPLQSPKVTTGTVSEQALILSSAGRSGEQEKERPFMLPDLMIRARVMRYDPYNVADIVTFVANTHDHFSITFERGTLVIVLEDAQHVSPLEMAEGDLLVSVVEVVNRPLLMVMDEETYRQHMDGQQGYEAAYLAQVYAPGALGEWPDDLPDDPPADPFATPVPSLDHNAAQ